MDNTDIVFNIFQQASEQSGVQPKHVNYSTQLYQHHIFGK